MDINLDTIKRIISSDELCDKVNSFNYRSSYITKIEDYVFSLCDSVGSANANIEFINRYLTKFVINSGSKEDIFFNRVLLRLYGYDIKDTTFINILNSFNFEEVKELLIQRYNQFIISNTFVNIDDLKKMLTFYCYVCPNYVMPVEYINYFTYYLISKSVVLDYDLICYYYKIFSIYFSNSKGIETSFEISNSLVDDPYYDNKNKKIIIYKQSIKNRIDYNILADIFFKIKYLYLIKCINDSSNRCYSYDQLCLVKEICLLTIMGDDFFDNNYGDISFSSVLKKQSMHTVRDYFFSIGLNIPINNDYEVLSVLNDIDDSVDKAISIDVLFDLTLKNENPNLLRGLMRNYPILGCEYRNDKRKSLLTLLLDIYVNRKLLTNLNRDLEWYNTKLGNGEDDVVMPKIKRLNNKISVCSSYINVMSFSINNGNMTSDDLVRSISDLITYDTNDLMIQNDICSILCNIVPKKIKNLCVDRNTNYKESLKKKIIKCYLDSMVLVKSNFDSIYFMRVYSSLELCIKAID